MTTIDIDELLDSQQAAALLGIKVNTLEIWRSKGRGPEFIKFGKAAQAPVRYRRSVVLKWIDTRSFASTTAYGVADSTSTKSISCPPSRATA